MGASKTKTVGGGANVQTGQDWNGFLQGMLGSGSNGPVGQTATGQVGANPQQATAQAGGFQQLLNGLMGQTPESMMQGNPLMQGVNNLPSAPTYQAPQLQNLNTNIGGSNIFQQMFGNGSQNPMANVQAPQVNAGMGGAATAGAPQQIGNVLGGPNTTGGLLDTANDPEMQAYAQLLNRQSGLDIANMRERFGQGGQSLSSGASLAEAQGRAEANSRNTLALGELSRAKQGLDMQNRGQNIGALLGQQGNMINQRGQDVQTGIANAQFGTQANLANMSNALQASLANAGNSLQAQGMNQNFAINQMAQQLQALGLDANTALQAAQMNNAGMQNMNQNQLQNSGMQNQFNQQNFGQQSSNAFNQAGIGAQLQGMQNQNQNNILAQLFQSFQQANQIGSPQAQTVQQPSGMSQALGAISGIAGMIPGIGQAIGSGTNILGGLFGGGGGQPQQFNGPTFSPGYAQVGSLMNNQR